jgi:hypothetical protein
MINKSPFLHNDTARVPCPQAPKYQRQTGLYHMPRQTFRGRSTMQPWKPLKNLAKHPVIKPDNTSEYYNGTNGDPTEFNANWARAITKNVFDIYMETNYKYDRFVYAGYSVNVDPPASWDTITFRPIKNIIGKRIFLVLYPKVFIRSL